MLKVKRVSGDTIWVKRVLIPSIDAEQHAIDVHFAGRMKDLGSQV
jgi:hypothetical protein